MTPVQIKMRYNVEKRWRIFAQRGTTSVFKKSIAHPITISTKYKRESPKYGELMVDRQNCGKEKEGLE